MNPDKKEQWQLRAEFNQQLMRLQGRLAGLEFPFRLNLVLTRDQAVAVGFVPPEGEVGGWYTGEYFAPDCPDLFVVCVEDPDFLDNLAKAP